jgi:hypothetical protein
VKGSNTPCYQAGIHAALPGTMGLADPPPVTAPLVPVDGELHLPETRLHRAHPRGPYESRSLRMAQEGAPMEDASMPTAHLSRPCVPLTLGYETTPVRSLVYSRGAPATGSWASLLECLHGAALPVPMRS